jgi:hypothetical protein
MSPSRRRRSSRSGSDAGDTADSGTVGGDRVVADAVADDPAPQGGMRSSARGALPRERGKPPTDPGCMSEHKGRSLEQSAAAPGWRCRRPQAVPHCLAVRTVAWPWPPMSPVASTPRKGRVTETALARTPATWRVSLVHLARRGRPQSRRHPDRRGRALTTGLRHVRPGELWSSVAGSDGSHCQSRWPVSAARTGEDRGHARKEYAPVSTAVTAIPMPAFRYRVDACSPASAPRGLGLGRRLLRGLTGRLTASSWLPLRSSARPR